MMYSYTLTTFDKQVYHKQSTYRTLDIMDMHAQYQRLMSPFKTDFKGNTVYQQGFPVYLHPYLDPDNLQCPNFWEEHSKDVVATDQCGKDYRICDFWKKTVDTASVSFLEQLAQQISSLLFDQIARAISPESKLYLFDSTAIEKNGYSYLYLSITPLKVCYNDFWVKWKSLLPEKEYIKMDEPVDSSMLQFSWCTPEEEINCSKIRFFGQDNLGVRTLEKIQEQLPVKAPKIRTKASDSIPKSHKRNMSFACDISENIGYPDVCFTFCFYEAIDGNDEKRINDALERFVTKYNSGHANKIHDFFRLDEPIDIPDELPPERVIQFAVDFGNCNPKVIERLINYLQRINLGIEKLILL